MNRSSHNSLDSGYGTASNRTSSATTTLLDSASSVQRRSQQSPLGLRLENRLSSNAQPGHVRPDSYQADLEIPEIDPTLEAFHHDHAANQYTADDYLSDFYAHDQSSPALEPTNSSTAGEHVSCQLYQPPHAAPSRCNRAGLSSASQDLGLETCEHCGATKLHHLASISLRTDIAVFKEVVRTNLSFINETDNEGNSCIHFAAGASASLEQLKVLQHAGANVICSNYSGQTLLHLLDPKVYGRTLPAVLTWALQLGLSFLQRDCDGQTPFHHILGRHITLTTAHDLMPFLQNASRSMAFLDRNGRTPLDVLRDNWQKANHGVHLSQLEAQLITHNVPVVYQGLPSSRSKVPAPLLDVGRLAFSGRDESIDDILNIIDRSQHEAYCQNSRRQNTLHALAALSFHANHHINCYMAPYDLLQCLQQRLENSTEIGVDVNQYNSDGFTPLHCFLYVTFDININSDIPWLVPTCVQLLLNYGADPMLRDRYGNTALHLACSRARFECAGKIYSHLSRHYVRQQYMQCLSAVNDRGNTVIEETEASMGSETLEANDRRKQCIGFVRAALTEPMYSYMPAASQSAASSSMTTNSPLNKWSAQLPSHGRKSSISSAELGPGYCKGSSWPSRTSSLEENPFEIRSAFED